MLYLNIDVMNLTGFQPYGIEILTHRQGFGDQKLVWIYSNCWNYSSRIGHQNSQDKRHANPNHFRSPKLDQPWWTNWKWENFMIAWIMTMISNNIAKAKFSAFSLHFHQTIFARLSIYRLKSVDRVKGYDTGLTANYDQLWQLWRPWSFIECALCCLFVWDLTTSVRSCLEPKEAGVSHMLCTYICTYMHVCMTPIPLTPPTTVTVTVRAIHCTWVTHMPTASWLFLASNWTLIRYWDDYNIHSRFMQKSIYPRTNMTSWGISSKSKRNGRLRNVIIGTDGCQEPKLLQNEIREN